MSCSVSRFRHGAVSLGVESSELSVVSDTYVSSDGIHGTQHSARIHHSQGLIGDMMSRARSVGVG
jgi:hypothetical protein